jgi:hypothetical protein
VSTRASPNRKDDSDKTGQNQPRPDALSSARQEAAAALPLPSLTVTGSVPAAAQHPRQVRATVDAAIARGLAGIGVEDTTGAPSNPIRDFDDAVRRIEAAAAAARGDGSS